MNKPLTRESFSPLGWSAGGRLSVVLLVVLLLWAAVGWALDWWL